MRCLSDRLRVRIALFAVLLSTQSFGYNHPEIQWKTVATEHFLIHYYDKTECGVYATYKTAEESYRVMEKLYGFKLQEKINIAIADYDDYSNGLAAWTQDNIMIWLPDARFDLRGNSTWLRNVITHELAHIISLSKYDSQRLGWSLGFDYSGKHTGVSVARPFPLTVFYPSWFSEGTAQRESERAGNDCWDSRRDMLLRCAILQDRQLSLGEMAHFNHDAIGFEMVYNQGFSFVKFLEARFGTKRITELWNEGRSFRLGGFGFRGIFRRQTGRDIQELYDLWVDSLRTEYQAMVPEDQGSLTPVWEGGAFNKLPRISSDNRYWGWLTSEGGDYRRTDLVLAENGSSKPVVRIKYARQSWSFSSNGSKVYYVKARRPNEKGSYFNDIYEYDVKHGTHRRITHDGRVYDVVACNDGTSLLVVAYDNGMFNLKRCNTETGTLTGIVPGRLGAPFLSPAIDPGSSQKAVVTRYRNGSTDLLLVDLADKSLTPLRATPASEESPHWGSDGRIYFSADYDGIFNVYSVLPDGTDLQRHSSVAGGLFQPVVTTDGDLVCSEYTAEGFRIVSGPSRGRSYQVESAGTCGYKEVPRPRGKVRIKSYPYRPRYLRSTGQVTSLFSVSDPGGAFEQRVAGMETPATLDSVSLMGTIAASRVSNDALFKKTMGIAYGGLVAGNLSDETSSSSTLDSALHDLHRGDGFFGEYSRTGPGAGMVRRSLNDMRRQMSTGSLSSEAEEDRSQNAPPVFGQLFGQVYFQSAQAAPVAQLSVEVATMPFPFLLPGFVKASGTLEWQLGRNWWMGMQPSTFWAPFLQMFEINFPLYLAASQWAYRTEDAGYNMAHARWGSAYIAPAIIPVNRLDSLNFKADHLAAFAFGVSGGAGFPVSKNWTIVERAGFSGSFLDGGQKYSVGGLKRPSDAYYSFTNRISTVFPLARNVNSDGWYYFEDLYGEVFFASSLSANGRLFDPFDIRYLTTRDFDADNVAVTHKIGTAVEFGVTHSYLFSRSLRLSTAWDLWDRELNLQLSLGL